jgi:hypothetical protein
MFLFSEDLQQDVVDDERNETLKTYNRKQSEEEPVESEFITNSFADELEHNTLIVLECPLLHLIQLINRLSDGITSVVDGVYLFCQNGRSAWVHTI